MKYEYERINEDGQTERGTLESDSRQSALAELAAKPGVTLEIKERKQEKLRGKVSRKEFARFFKELSTLLSAGVPIASAIESMASNAVQEIEAVTYTRMGMQLNQGKALSTILEDLGTDQIPNYMVQLVKAGEASGALAHSMGKGADQMLYEQQIAVEARSALVYPSILILAGILAIGLVFAIVIPNFTDILDEADNLPAISILVLNTGMFVNENIVILVFITAFIVGLVMYYLRNEKSRTLLLNFASKISVFGRWLRQSDEGRWASIMAALISSGVPLMRSIDLANSGIRLDDLRLRYNRVGLQVRQGSSLSKALKQESLLWPVAFSMLDVGEKAGELPKMLESISILCEKTTSERYKRMLVLIEPIAILLIGGLIGTIILGIVLAITAANEIPL